MFNDRKFGIELEGYNADRDSIKHLIRDLGYKALTNNYSGSDYDVWQIKEDSSIEGRNSFEIVSPILQGESGVRELTAVLEALDASDHINIKVNKSCGFHVHWGIEEFSTKQLKMLGKHWVKYEQGLDLIQPPSRRGYATQYVRSNLGDISCHASNEMYHDHAKRKMQSIGKRTSIERLIDNEFSSRYCKLNLKSFWRLGTAEFRHHSATFNAEKIINWLHLTYSMVHKASKGYTLQPFPAPVSRKRCLDAMLKNSLKRDCLPPEVAKYYRKRAKELNNA